MWCHPLRVLCSARKCACVPLPHVSARNRWCVCGARGRRARQLRVDARHAELLRQFQSRAARVLREMRHAAVVQVQRAGGAHVYDHRLARSSRGRGHRQAVRPREPPAVGEVLRRSAGGSDGRYAGWAGVPGQPAKPAPATPPTTLRAISATAAAQEISSTAMRVWPRSSTLAIGAARKKPEA